jgi:DNA-binding response OmpR family regulator
MANLRKKIEDNSSDPKLILSVRGVGYKIVSG